MTPKEVKILDKEIQYLCEQQDRVKAIREYTGIHPNKTFLNEVETIENLYRSILENRKECKSTYFSVGTAGWCFEHALACLRRPLILELQFQQFHLLRHNQRCSQGDEAVPP